MHPSRSGAAAEPAELDREFSPATLAALRDAVLAYAAACGMSQGRATDVMLAVHELAANAVRHGPGHGRVRMWVTGRTLRCEVSDPGQAGDDQWEVKEGHGLWLVGKTADHVSVTSGPEGSRITVRFALTG